MSTPSDQIVVTIPLPPRILSPNCPIGSFRGRMMRAAAAKKQKRLAKASAEDAMRECPGWSRASYRAVFYFKTKRRRDDVNHLAELKAAIDGVIEAGLLPDDDREHLRVTGAEFAIDKEWPRVEIIFTKED